MYSVRPVDGHHRKPKKRPSFLMRKLLEKGYLTLNLLGIYPKVLVNNLKGLPFYYRDLKKIKQQRGKDTTFRFGKRYPILGERFAQSGEIRGYYFHHDLHVARRIYEVDPERHLDVGSRIDGFVAHVAVFRPIEVLDIREQTSKVRNVVFMQADLTQLPEDMTHYCDSISSLNAIEHFGLGRYGDPIDYYGHEKAIRNITEILQPGGRFYFAVPIGEQRIEFNAHRVFSLRYLLDLFAADYSLAHFSWVDDAGEFHEDQELTPSAVATNLGCRFGCGIFELVKMK